MRGDSFQLCAVLGGKAMESSNIVLVLFGAFGVFFVVLAVLLLYRGTLSTKEDNQICIDKEKQHHVEEQKELIARMARLRTPIILLTVISAVLLFSAVGVWLYIGLSNF
jgi:UDP-N-acetylmuramyl pentapeptide phosphotransferase/UDP-N-acetylglucosamine-1-phosphate transferase